jgi:hypothetical protein
MKRGGAERQWHRVTRWTVLLLAAALLVAGCLPSTPSRSDWRSQAAQALEDLASEMATAQVVLRERHRDHLPARTPRVLLVDAEEAAGQTAETFTALQPPPGWESRHGEITDLLDEGAGLLTDTRIAVVRGGAPPDGLASDLASKRKELLERAEALR